MKHPFPTHPYLWTGTTIQGSHCAGEIRAISSNVARTTLAHQGIIANQITKKKRKLLLPENKRISTTDLTLFYRQFATLIATGIPIAEACKILLKTPEKTFLHSIIKMIKHQLEIGNTLASGLAKYPRFFDPLTCYLVHIGEQTGKLDIMLTRIADYKEKSLLLKNKIKQALLYPTLVLIAALAISLSMLILVVPRFAELFTNFHSKLPAFTLAVLHLSEFFQHNYGFLILIVTSPWFVFRYLKTIPRYTLYLDKVIFALPLINTLFKKVILIRLTSSLAAILSAGVPLTEALKMAHTMSRNHVVKNSIQQIYQKIEIGQQLHHAMRNNILFPEMVIQMVKVGEESGTLESMLEKVAEFYEIDIDYWTNNFSQILEPLIIVILGVLIGGLVIAMYLPIFKLGTVI
jgi:type IV pilus assembly protein PilC